MRVFSCPIVQKSGLNAARCLSFFSRICVCICVCVCTLLPACAPAAEVDASAATSEIPMEAAPTPTSTPVPAPTPLPEPGALCAMAEEAFRAALRPDFSAYAYGAELNTIPELMEAQATFTGMSEAYSAAAKDAASAALSAVRQVLPNAAFGRVRLAPAPWKLMVALSNDAAEAPADKLARLTSVTVTLGRDNAVHIESALPELGALMENEAPATRYGMVSIYAYLNTAYDENGEPRDYDGAYSLTPDYIAGLADPLPKRFIKNGWFNDRSNATRRHTGTDIRAREGEDILSCTGGTVWAIDYGELAGNYVAVMDEAGFLYCYCHMVTLTDFLLVGDAVSAGDVIGHVGNTGNSDAPHLHLSIISPEYAYINPYPVLRAVRGWR